MDDIVGFSSDQHAQIRRLCADVAVAARPEKELLLAQLAALVHRHERSDRAVVHPAVRDRTTGGAAHAVQCMVEAGDVQRALGDLRALGSGDVTFEAAFASFQRALLDHLAHEERSEFPRLRRYVPTQRLHAMVHEAVDIQLMR